MLEQADKSEQGLADKDAWKFFDRGVEIMSVFIEKEKNNDFASSQVSESEAAREMRRFFDKLHGKLVEPYQDSINQGEQGIASNGHLT